jgi:hypothetical protein
VTDGKYVTCIQDVMQGRCTCPAHHHTQYAAADSLSHCRHGFRKSLLHGGWGNAKWSWIRLQQYLPGVGCTTTLGESALQQLLGEARD